MTLDQQSAIEDAEQDAAGDHVSLGDTIQRVTGAAREALGAEMALLRLRGTLFGASAKWIAIFGVVAFITAFGMIVTLMIGAVLALAPLWGLGLALLAVTGVALLAILLCGWGISVQVGRMKRIFP